MKRRLSWILAAAMLLSLFSFVSCDKQQIVNDVLDAALAVVEAIPDSAETAEETQSADTSEVIAETEGETEAESVPAPEAQLEEIPEVPAEPAIDENGWYDDRDNVALYLYTYGKLPPNYVTKEEAEKLYGWEGGSLHKYAEGMAIGGSKFGNYEGLLPKKNGRQYYECDIDTVDTNSRGAKRIVYSNDGLIYYTEDHYESFELLYGEEQ